MTYEYAWTITTARFLAERQKKKKNALETDLAEASDQEIHCGAVETRVVLQHSFALGQDLERVELFPHIDFAPLHRLANVFTLVGACASRSLWVHLFGIHALEQRVDAFSP